MQTISLNPPLARRGDWLQRAALLLLCAAYLQGGFAKLGDFSAAQAEMRHFGLTPAGLIAALVLTLELGASVLVISGWWRWLGAAALAAFTLAANFMANRYWELNGMERFMAENGFYEHLGLVGGFLLVAGLDLRERVRLRVGARQPR